MRSPKMLGIVFSLFVIAACMYMAPDAYAAGHYSAWGSWSAWQDASVSSTNTRQVETRSVAVSYDMEVYVCGNSNKQRCYLKAMKNGYTQRAHYKGTWPASQLDSAPRYAEGTWYSYANNVNGWIIGPGTGYTDGNHVPFFIVKTNKKTQYRYRTRTWIVDPAPKPATEIGSSASGGSSSATKPAATAPAATTQPSAQQAASQGGSANPVPAATQPAGSSVSGLVCTARKGKAIKGAKVKVCMGSKTIAKCKSKKNGSYTSKRVAAGSYVVKISKKGYITLKCHIVVENGTACYMDKATLAKKAKKHKKAKGKAKGSVKSATTGKGVKKCRIKFKRNWNNPGGKTVKSCKTSRRGTYTARLTCGYYTAVVSCRGYVKGACNVTVQKGTTRNQNCIINPKRKERRQPSASSVYRVVLTWGASPKDLDSHLASPANGGEGYHVFFGNMRPVSTAMLDVDDVTSYGPETVTFVARPSKTYRYYVYKYSRSGKALKKSSAKVKVYRDDKLVKTYNVPSPGKGRYWNVFKLKDGKLTTVNKISKKAKGVSYAVGREGKH